MKKWYESKTIWVNLLVLAAFVLQIIYDKEMISLEVQGAILTVINLVLRIVTNKEINWGGEKDED